MKNALGLSITMDSKLENSQRDTFEIGILLVVESQSERVERVKANPITDWGLGLCTKSIKAKGCFRKSVSDLEKYKKPAENSLTTK